uniref:DNA-directed DNA polymerase n=1 Tax=Tanacetum cinerariifolium TaxID=118510 RepID=A0A6L2LP75_TANCI|nr:DNA-directed DNA polymerase [Tanacetum cinerariifolium]
MVDNRTIEEMLQASTEGITSTLKFRDVPNDAIKLMLFPYSLEGAAKIWYEKEPPRSILQWGDLITETSIRVKKNEIDNFKVGLKKEIHSSIQNQRNTVKNELKSDINKLRNMMASYFQMNTASSLGSDSLPSNTVPNPRADLKVITTRSVVDYIFDPHVPLILGRPFLRTRRALIDVYGEELTLCVDYEAITFNVGQTSKYSYNDAESINRIDVIDVACEDYVQDVLGFSDNFKSGSPTLALDPIISSSSTSFTPFEGSDFGDTLYLEKFLNEDPSPNLPLVKTEDLKQVDATMTKPSIEEPPDLELKELLSHLKYVFLEGTDKLPVIISKELKVEEKSALLKVDFKPAVQHQRRVNSKIHEVIKEEVIKLLNVGLIYPIFDSPWVSPVHCVPKKGGITVVENEDNELIPTRCMKAIFHDMIKKMMDVFMDDFLVASDSFSLCLSYFDKMLQRCDDTNLVLNWEKCHFMVKEGIVIGHKISKSGIEVDRAKVNVIAKLSHPTFVKENLAADHLSRLENPHQDELKKKEITKTFPLETLGMVAFCGDSSTLWFSDFANYHAGNFIVKRMSWCIHDQEAIDILTAYHNGPTEGHHGANLTTKKIAPDLEASRARGFVHRPLELQSFAYGNSIS